MKTLEAVATSAKYEVSQLYLPSISEMDQRVADIVEHLQQKRRHKNNWGQYQEEVSKFVARLSENQKMFFWKYEAEEDAKFSVNQKISYRFGFCAGVFVAISGLNLLNEMAELESDATFTSKEYFEHRERSLLFDYGLQSSLNESQKNETHRLEERRNDKTQGPIFDILERVGRRDGWRFAKEKGFPSLAYLLKF